MKTMKVLIRREGLGLIKTPKNFILPLHGDIIVLNNGVFIVTVIKYNYIKNEITVLLK